MPIAVVRTAWSGTSGGPGLTQLYVASGNGFNALTAAEAQTAVNAVRKFWAALVTYLPDEIQLTISPVVDQYDIASGQLQSSVSAATPPLSVLGTSTGTFTMAAGMKVNLNTGNVRNGRRVRGAIYIVPASGGVMTATGVVAAVVRTAINAAGATLLSDLSAAGLGLVVYSRPLDADDKGGPRAGGVSNVSGIETNEKGAILRGRRD